MAPSGAMRCCLALVALLRSSSTSVLICLRESRNPDFYVKSSFQNICFDKNRGEEALCRPNYICRTDVQIRTTDRQWMTSALLSLALLAVQPQFMLLSPCSPHSDRTGLVLGSQIFFQLFHTLGPLCFLFSMLTVVWGCSSNLSSAFASLEWYFLTLI